jgi:sulfite reductase (NADPH) flavoprotein alpha-component
MLRKLHSLLGLIAFLLLVVLAVSGAILSVDPGLERLGSAVPADGRISVARLAGSVASHYPDVEQIQRTPSGSVIVYYSRDGQVGVDRVDPFTGQGIGPYAPSPTSRWVKNLHRSLLLATPGRVIAGITAVALVVLSVSGVLLLVRRQGGWRYLLRPPIGRLNQRWHALVGRVVVLGLLLSALTGAYLSATTFGLVPDGMDVEPDFPAEVVAGPTAAIDSLPALQATDLNDLRELVYPIPGNPTDVYSLSTARGEAYIDQATGAVLSYRAHDGFRRTYELIYMLHTGEGLWWLALLLGLCAISMPLMGTTGTLIWWQRRRSIPRIVDNSRPQSADAVILVGSENGSTWGFASVLHEALRQRGLRAHMAPMNQLAADYRSAKQLFILASTYGDGDPPSSANQFLKRLAKAKADPRFGFTVLGFGDRQFPQFCQFAKDVDAALRDRGWRQLLALHTIDRQSTQEFSRWGEAVGKSLGMELTLVHTPKRPKTHVFELVDRVDYGLQVEAPTSVLRFRSGEPQSGTGFSRLFGGGGMPYFEAGDLVGVLPPGSDVPRFYSLASGSKDGVLEICVRKHADGLCSRFLHGLSRGDHIDGFIQSNPHFRPGLGNKPVILIGAGTGIGPLAGFIRNNTGRHPMYLYWGGRDPKSDFLYEPELAGYLADQRLTALQTAFSRVKDGTHVQNRIVLDAEQVRRLVGSGAQILVCGSRAMAASVSQAIDEVLLPLNITVQMLKVQGRYREDVF